MIKHNIYVSLGFFLHEGEERVLKRERGNTRGRGLYCCVDMIEKLKIMEDLTKNITQKH